TGLADNSWTPTLICAGAAFFATPLIVYIGKRFNYQRAEYKVFDDRLEFEEGFLTINKKTVRFKDVREVSLRRGILQRAAGLGSIYLATQATGLLNFANPFAVFGFGNTSASGINIRDVPH